MQTYGIEANVAPDPNRHVYSAATTDTYTYYYSNLNNRMKGAAWWRFDARMSFVSFTSGV